jgi:hypothetical protein
LLVDNNYIDERRKERVSFFTGYLLLPTWVLEAGKTILIMKLKYSNQNLN